MNKLLRILENISLGLFVNGSYTIMTDDINIKSLLVAFISLYVMILVIVFQED
jgi:hypothetical protein